MISKILAIAGNTYLETIRQPIYGIVLILTCFMMILNCSLAAFTLSDDNLFLRDLGLSTLLVSGLFLAAFSAAGVVSREVENKTVLTIISKPVSRPTLVVGKFIGLVTALTTAFYISTIVMLLVSRHGVLQNTTDPWDFPVIIFGCGAVLVSVLVAAVGNYWYGWQFASTAIALFTPLITLAMMLVSAIDKQWKLQQPHVVEQKLLVAMLLVIMLVWVIAAVALASSCRLGQIATLIICVVVLMIGLTDDHFFGQHELANATVFERPTLAAQFSWFAYRVIPNLGVFWVTDALAADRPITFTYCFWGLGYAVLYITAILMVGIALFQKRELG